MSGNGDKENLLAAGAALQQHLRTLAASESFSAQGEDKLQQAPASTWEILISQIIEINFTMNKTDQPGHGTKLPALDLLDLHFQH